MRTEQKTAFDCWLHETLHKQFGLAEDDSVPDELLRLLPEADRPAAAQG